MAKNKKRLHQSMIEDAGSLLGGCATYADKTTIHSKKPFTPETGFGKWLQDLVVNEVDRVKSKQGT